MFLRVFWIFWYANAGRLGEGLRRKRQKKVEFGLEGDSKFGWG